MKLPIFLRAIAFQFTCAAQNGQLWDEAKAATHAAEAFVGISKLASMSDRHIPRWIKLGLAGIDADVQVLGPDGCDAACTLCNLLASECEHLCMTQAV